MAFTSITADTACNKLSLALQAAVAINKRCLALGQPAYFTQMPTAGTNLKSFIHDAQSHVESLLALTQQFFADPALTLAGQSSLPGAWGVSACMAAAGLTESGYWRRIPPGGSKPADWSDYADDAFSYGQAEDADLIGPWIWADLFSVLSKMTRMTYDPDPAIGNSRHDAEYVATALKVEDTYAGEFELSGTVAVTVAANATPVSGSVTVSKFRNSGLYSIQGEVGNHFVRFPRYNVLGAAETYTVVFIPRGDNVFPEITGVINDGVTNTSSNFELETGHILKWFWAPPSVINGAAIPWATLSAKLPWPATDNSSASLDISYSGSDMCLVTDYDFNDGSLS